MVDVTIPADVAKQIAEFLRSTDGHPDDNAAAECWADLLDPQPQTLRKKVAEAIWTTLYTTASMPPSAWSGGNRAADAVLTVVADWLAAQPVPYPNVVNSRQRDHDVRLLRGAS